MIFNTGFSCKTCINITRLSTRLLLAECTDSVCMLNRKLEEVRGRLDQLRGLVQYYQGDNEEVSSTVESEATEGQDLSLRGNIEGRRTLAADSVDDTSDADSSISLGEFGNDPEIQEKVR